MAAPVRKSVELFYDVISPYSWIGFEVMCRYRTKWNIDLKFRPFFLGGIMAGADNRPPGVVPSKSAYMARDLERLRDYYHVPLKHPANVAEVLFVKGSLPTMRFITAVNQDRPDMTESVSRELWLRIWNQDKDITEAESLAEAGKAAGLADGEVQNCLQKLKDPAVKELLKQTTQEALDLGAFGSPTIFIEDASGKKQMFFGSDRFHLLAHALGERELGPMVEAADPKARL